MGKLGRIGDFSRSLFVEALAFGFTAPAGSFSLHLDGRLTAAAILIAGAAGVALCLGADFVKVNPPHEADGKSSAEGLKIASMAAGRTGLVCAGGSKADANVFLTELHNQIHIGGACGNATGRNIHMRSEDEAIRLCNAISAITLGDWSVEDAEAVFRGGIQSVGLHRRLAVYWRLSNGN